jgi:hypothetical protein
MTVLCTEFCALTWIEICAMVDECLVGAGRTIIEMSDWMSALISRPVVRSSLAFNPFHYIVIVAFR